MAVTTRMSMRRPATGRAAVLAMALALLPTLAGAQGAASQRAPEVPLWELGVGGAVLSLPHYRGSDQSRTWLLPLPYAVYRGDILRADREGARAVLVDSDRIDIDLSADLNAPAKARDNRARQGMADLPPVVEVGPKVNLRLLRSGDWRVDLRVPVHAAIALRGRGHDAGWVVVPQITVDTRLGGWDAGLVAAAPWGSRRYHALTYDVAARDATAQRPAYASGAGSAGWQFTAGISRRIGNVWLGAYLRHDSVRGAVFETSPLVRRSSNVSGGVAFAWVFGESAVRVPDPNLR